MNVFKAVDNITYLQLKLMIIIAKSGLFAVVAQIAIRARKR